MKLVRWSPTTEINRFGSEMDDFFNNFFTRTFPDVKIERACSPRINLRELEDSFELTAEIPGMGKDELNIEVQEDILTIRGEKKAEEKLENEKMHICEMCYGKFERSFRLPDNIKTDGLEAEYTNGILKIMLPKAEPVKPKEIIIK